MLSEKNQQAVDEIARQLEVEQETVVDNIVTYWRAERAVQDAESLSGALLAFVSELGEDGRWAIRGGDVLYNYLVANLQQKYRQIRDRDRSSTDGISGPIPEMTEAGLQKAYQAFYRLARRELDHETDEVFIQFIESDATALEHLGGWEGLQRILLNNDGQTIRAIFRKWWERHSS